MTTSDENDEERNTNEVQDQPNDDSSNILGENSIITTESISALPAPSQGKQILVCTRSTSDC